MHDLGADLGLVVVENVAVRHLQGGAEIGCDGCQGGFELLAGHGDVVDDHAVEAPGERS